MILQLKGNDVTSEDLLNSGTVDAFGQKVFSDIKFDLGNDTVVISRSVIEVNRQHTIVSTPLQGRDGTVKEYISAQDWAITVRGSVQTQDLEKYPLAEVRKIVRMMSKGERIDVISEYLALFDIHSMVLESDNYPQADGQQNIQNFELRFLSDKDLPLILKEEN